MAYEELKHVEGSVVTGITKSADGTPCAGMTMDGEVLLQFMKARGPMVYGLAKQLREDPQVLNALGGPVDVVSGLAVHIRKSIREGRVVLESDPTQTGLYVKAAVAEVLNLLGASKFNSEIYIVE